MWKTAIIALRATVVTLIVTGIAYPILITGLAQVLFPGRANGSLVQTSKGEIVGSELIGQAFKNPGYFHSRPSAAGDNGYDAANSDGSNLGPTSKKLRGRIIADTQRLTAQNPEARGPVPIDLVTASGSGLDPDISPEASLWQAPRIARARQVDPERVRQVVESHIEGRQIGILGEPRVNVLLLDLALDRQFGRMY